MENITPEQAKSERTIFGHQRRGNAEVVISSALAMGNGTVGK